MQHVVSERLDQGVIGKMYLHISVCGNERHIDANVGSTMNISTVKPDDRETIAEHGRSLLIECQPIVEQGEDHNGAQSNAPTPGPALELANDEPAHRSKDEQVTQED